MDELHLEHKVWRKAVGVAKVRFLPFHGLRHTYASILLDLTKDVFYVQRQLGHGSIQMTVDVDGHPVGGSNQAAVALLDAEIERQSHVNQGRRAA